MIANTDDRINAPLAIDGGTPIRTGSIPGRKPFDLDETRELIEAVSSGNLFYATGNKVYSFVDEFKALFDAAGAVPSSSGTAAIHVAIGALQPEPGDEIIVPPVTDMGSVAPIVLSGAVPVFVDVEPDTFNLDPDDLARRITDRTRAVIVVHVWGRPANLDAVRDVIGDRKIAIIEDCAEAHYVRYKGKLVGTMGDFGCFSFQQSKHITCGDGGITLVNRPDLLQRAELFVDKGCDWTKDRLYRKTYAFMAPCYRMSELQGAVLRAQLRKLPGIIARRRTLGDRLARELQDTPGIRPPLPSDDVYDHGYWSFPIRVIEEELGCNRDVFMKALSAEGVKSHTWITQPLYLYDALAKQIAFGTSSWPFKGTGREEAPVYAPGLCPNAEMIMQQLVTIIGLHEQATDGDIDDISAAVRKVAAGLAARKAGG
jgi:dTDP-4-amino-4,6-dideoxygalactose transaminase